MKFFLGIVLSSLICSCANYEKIGHYKYRIKTQQVFTGDYGGIVQFVKSYYLKDKFQAGYIIKSQLGFEPLVDTIFSKGTTEINPNGTLKLKEYYFYGYKDFLKTDSILKVFEQQLDGTLKLVLYMKDNKEMKIPEVPKDTK